MQNTALTIEVIRLEQTDHLSFAVRECREIPHPLRAVLVERIAELEEQLQTIEQEQLDGI